jgi:Bax protein
MFKLTLIIALIAFGISKHNEREPCTDDGCPEFFDEIETPIPNDDIRGDLREIEKDWKKAVVVAYNPIHLEYGVHKIVQKTYSLPDVDTSSNENFVQSLNTCINYLYQSIEVEYQIPNELIIAQAVIETGWGKSRFANEGNNLFGIRTWDKDVPYLLPIPWTKWPGWGVKMYSSKCESVVDYLHILNNVHAFKELREARASGVNDALELANYLEKYASKPTYIQLVKEIIKYNIRGVYDL